MRGACVRSGVVALVALAGALLFDRPAQAQSCGQVVPGASTAFYQGRFGSAGGDGYCHARTGNEPNTNVPIYSDADCRRVTGNLYVEYDRDGGKNFNDCVFRVPSGGAGGGGVPSPPPFGQTIGTSHRRCYTGSTVEGPDWRLYDETQGPANAIADCTCPANTTKQLTKASFNPSPISGDNEYWCKPAAAAAPAPAPQPQPPQQKASYTIRVCNNAGGGDAWVAHLAYLAPDSENFWKLGWFRVRQGQCLDTLTLPFGRHRERSFWTVAQFDSQPYFWPRQALDPALDQMRQCIPAPSGGFRREAVQGADDPCGNDWNRFFEEQEVTQGAGGNTVATVNLKPVLTEVPFKLHVCNRTDEAELWVAVGLPTARSPSQPYLRGWARIAKDDCAEWLGYHYPDNRAVAYFVAQSFGPKGTTIWGNGEKPVEFCVPPVKQLVDRVNTAGYQCAGKEQPLGFYPIRLPHLFPTTTTTVNIGGEIEYGE